MLLLLRVLAATPNPQPRSKATHTRSTGTHNKRNMYDHRREGGGRMDEERLQTTKYAICAAAFTASSKQGQSIIATGVVGQRHRAELPGGCLGGVGGGRRAGGVMRKGTKRKRNVTPTLTLSSASKAVAARRA